jgi:glyoxylase-like metal-dependent hydrolase (beta-lactamase superfamily II)
MARSAMEAAEVILEVRAVPPFGKNGFVVGSENTREAVIIDPGDEVDQLLEIVQRQKLTPTHILLTHAHVDHVTGVGRAKQALDVPIYLHRDDNFLYEAVQKSRRPSIIFTIRDTRFRWASSRSACTTRPAIVRVASVSPLGFQASLNVIYSWEIRCLPDRSAAPIFLARTTAR